MFKSTQGCEVAALFCKPLLFKKFLIGIKKALHGIGKRINYSNDLEKSFEILNASILDFELEFELFFDEIKEKTSSFFVD